MGGGSSGGTDRDVYICLQLGVYVYRGVSIHSGAEHNKQIAFSEQKHSWGGYFVPFWYPLAKKRSVQRMLVPKHSMIILRMR